MYKFREWIDISCLCFHGLSNNYNAVWYLEKNISKIDFFELSQNENAIHIIEKNLDKVDKYLLTKNKEMKNLLRNHKEFINYNALCSSEHWIDEIEKLFIFHQKDKIKWLCLSLNPAAIHILEKNTYNIDWASIVYNKNAIDLIKENISKIKNNWNISSQTHLLFLIEQGIIDINWILLSGNKNACHILKNNLEKINILRLCDNDNGFELLLLLEHVFNDSIHYSKQIVIDYFNYCTKHNIHFLLIKNLCICAYTNEHFQYLLEHYDMIDYYYLSHNPNICIYDYEYMKNERKSHPYYYDIIKIQQF